MLDEKEVRNNDVPVDKNLPGVPGRYSDYCMDCECETWHWEYCKPEGGGFLLCTICDPPGKQRIY